MLTTLLIAMLAQASPQPSQAELEAAILAHNVMLFSNPRMCPPGARNCPKGPRRIAVTQFMCDATGTDHRGQPFLVCRTSYRFIGGDLDGVRANMECVPVRWTTGTADAPAWRVVLVDEKIRCGTK